MKTIQITFLFLFLRIISINNSAAQSIINPDFEQTDTINNFPFPANWTSDGTGGTVSTLSQSGNYSIMIWNWYWYGRAYAFNGEDTGFGGAYKSGTPYTQKALKLNGYYRYDTSYTQSNDDSAIVAVLLKKYNTVLNKVDTVGYGITYLPSFSPGDGSFSLFEVIIQDLQPGIQPDSIVIFMQSSISGFCSMATSGECLYFNVDNLSLETPLGLTDIAGDFLAPEIYPNPSSGIFNFSLPSMEMETLKIFSIDGKIVYQKFFVGQNQLSVDLQGNKPGVYFARIIDKKGFVYSSKIIID